MQWSSWHTVGAAVVLVVLVMYTQAKFCMGAYVAARRARNDPTRLEDGLRAIRLSLRVPSLFGWPKTQHKRVVLAQLLAQMGRTQEALSICEPLAERLTDPQQRAELLLAMAECYDREWRVDEAIDAAEKAVEAMRDAGGGGASALVAQAKTASLRGDAREAAVLGGRATTQLAASLAKAEPALAEVAVASARVMELTALGKLDEAVKLADGIPHGALSGPFGSPLAAAASTAYLNAGLPDRARRVVPHIEDESARQRVLVAVSMAEGNYTEALSLCEALEQETPADPSLLDQHQRALMCLGRFEEAVDAAGPLLGAEFAGLGVGPRNAIAVLLNNTAEALMELGRHRDARACLDRVLQMPAMGHPTSARTEANLARAALGLGEAAEARLSRAEDQVCSLIERSGRPAAAILALGRALLEAGRAEKAAKYLGMMEHHSRDVNLRLAAAHDRARALAALGRVEEAQGVLCQAAQGPDEHWLTQRARSAMQIPGQDGS